MRAQGETYAQIKIMYNTALARDIFAAKGLAIALKKRKKKIIV